jgi:hypothetical protein
VATALADAFHEASKFVPRRGDIAAELGAAGYINAFMMRGRGRGRGGRKPGGRDSEDRKGKSAGWL